MLNMVALLCLFVKYAQICNILTQREVMRNKKEQCSSEGIKLEDTGYGYTLSGIGGKYKMIVLFWIVETGPALRFNDLKRKIGSISFKTLTSTLRELERDGIIQRKVYPQIPPKVEYSLTEKGKSLIPVMDAICDWGTANRNK